MSRADFALLRRAARERWGVPDPLRTEALYAAAKTLADDEASHRDKLAAIKLLMEADKVDQADEKLALDRAKFDHTTKPDGSQPDDFDFDISADDQAQQTDRPSA